MHVRGWSTLVSVLVACNAGGSETGGSDAGGTETDGSDTGGTETGIMIDPGAADEIGCAGALWARMGDTNETYERLGVFTDGGTVVSGMWSGLNRLDGRIVHRGPDAEVQGLLFGEGVMGSRSVLGGVYAGGGYAVAASSLVAEDCWFDPNDEYVCTQTWERRVRVHGRDDELLWQTPASEGDLTILGVTDGGTLVAVGGSEMIGLGPGGEPLWTRSLSSTWPFSLVGDDGYFATAEPPAVLRVDRDLVVRWTVDPTTLFHEYRTLAPAPDGGLVLVGRPSLDAALRVVRLDPDGHESWQHDTDVVAGEVLTAAVGASGAVAIAGYTGGMDDPAIDPTHGWLRTITATGEPAWGVDCLDRGVIQALAVEPAQVVVLGTTPASRPYIAAFPAEGPAR